MLMRQRWLSFQLSGQQLTEVEELTERLELHYLANRDPNLHFALLGDFKDAETESSQAG